MYINLICSLDDFEKILELDHPWESRKLFFFFFQNQNRLLFVLSISSNVMLGMRGFRLRVLKTISGLISLVVYF